MPQNVKVVEHNNVGTFNNMKVLSPSPEDDAVVCVQFDEEPSVQVRACGSSVDRLGDGFTALTDMMVNIENLCICVWKEITYLVAKTT